MYHKTSPFKNVKLLGNGRNRSSSAILQPHEEEKINIENENPLSIISSCASPFDTGVGTISTEIGSMIKINPSIVNKNGNYTSKVFELRKDPGDYQPTTFETLKTDQFLKPSGFEPVPPPIINVVGIEKDLQTIYRRMCLAEIYRDSLEPEDEIICAPTEEEPIPHTLHSSEFLASKNIWEKPKESPSYIHLLALHSILAAKHTPGTAKFFDLRFPLCRKLAICMHRAGTDSSPELIHATSVVGYLSAPQLVFGTVSRATIATDSTLPINDILSADILRSFGRTAVSIVTCGFEHCAVLTASGTVAAWGYGGSGCLGQGNYVSYTSPKLVKGLPAGVVHVESGAYHTAALTSGGQLFVWGRSDVGQLGVAQEALENDSMGWVALRPVEVGRVNEVRRVAVGEAHTLVLDDRGVAYVAGWGHHGQRGAGKEGEDVVYEFEVVKGLEAKQVTAVGAGSLFSAAIDADGNLYTWGNGDYGQLGIKQTEALNEEVYVPTIVDLGEEFAMELCCGESNMLVYCRSGKVYGWGQGCSEGIKKEVRRKTPELISKVDTVQYYGIHAPEQPPLPVPLCPSS